MKLNVGNLESFFRIFTGVVLLFCALYGFIGQWGLLGAVLIGTGMARFCPLTALLGINTYRCEGQSDSH
jgi:hypothetical protein